MLVAEILSANKKTKIADVFIPENEKDIKYSAFLEFSMKAQKIHLWQQEQIDKGAMYEVQYQKKVCQAVAEVLNVDPKILDNTTFNKESWVWQAWYMIHNIIANYTGSENGGMFRINGKKFVVPEVTRSLIRDGFNLNALTFGQVSEIAYIEKQLNDVLIAIKDREIKENYIGTDDEVSSTFTYTLMKIAVCLADPNTIPNESSMYDTWLEDKVIELQDISMKDAIDTIFFLTGMPKDCAVLIDLDTTLKQFHFAAYLKKNQLTMNPEDQQQNLLEGKSVNE